MTLTEYDLASCASSAKLLETNMSLIIYIKTTTHSTIIYSLQQFFSTK